MTNLNQKEEDTFPIFEPILLHQGSCSGEGFSAGSTALRKTQYMGNVIILRIQTCRSRRPQT